LDFGFDFDFFFAAACLAVAGLDAFLLAAARWRSRFK
jgi:hypothetical protein